jgi:psp operon transcriptional activator
MRPEASPAAKTRHGRFEEADSGTLFWTSSGPCPCARDRLLRAVEYGEITHRRVRPISVDVRIVAATNGIS